MRKLERGMDDPCSRKMNSWLWVLCILVDLHFGGEEGRMEDAWFFVPITTTGDCIVRGWCSHAHSSDDIANGRV